jgi:hypothetical protein
VRDYGDGSNHPTAPGGPPCRPPRLNGLPLSRVLTVCSFRKIRDARLATPKRSYEADWSIAAANAIAMRSARAWAADSGRTMTLKFSI